MLDACCLPFHHPSRMHHTSHPVPSSAVYVDVCADSQNNKAKSAMAALAASTRNPAKGSVAAVKASTAVRGSAAAAIVDAATAAVAPLKEGSNSAGGCAVMYNPCVDDGAYAQLCQLSTRCWVLLADGSPLIVACHAIIRQHLRLQASPRT